MIYFASILLLIMAIALTTCGVLLWKRQNEVDDYSRSIQAISSWMLAGFAVYMLLRIWMGTFRINNQLMEPAHVFIPVFMLLCMIVYPIEVLHTHINRTYISLLFFVPLLAIAFVGLYAGIDYIPIYTYANLQMQLTQPDVLFRLFTLFILPLTALVICLLPYDKQITSAYHRYINRYVFCMCLICLLYATVQLTRTYYLPLVLVVVVTSFFVVVTYIELRKRTYIPKTGE